MSPDVEEFVARQRTVGSRAFAKETTEKATCCDALGKPRVEERPLTIIVQQGPIAGPLPRDVRTRLVTPGPNRQHRRHPPAEDRPKTRPEKPKAPAKPAEAARWAA